MIRITGRLKKEPIAETITSGSYKSTACPVIINISTPNASHERIIVPKFPLLEGLSNNTINGLEDNATFSNLSSLISIIANNSEVSSFPLNSFSNCAVRV